MSDNLQNRDVRCYLTNAGRAAELKAIENNQPITITHMIIDADVLPDSTDPKTVAEITNQAHAPFPASVNAKVEDGLLHVVSDIPADVGGFHINGIGYALADGTIYAYARGMGDYKRRATDGQNDVLRIECEIKTQNSDRVTHTYDASKLYVNHFEFNEYKIAHIQAADPHTQYQQKAHAATTSEIDAKASSTLKHINLSMLWRALSNWQARRRINTTGALKGGRNLAGDVTLSVDRATTSREGVTQLTDSDGASSNLAASQKLVRWLKTTLTNAINTKHSEAKAYTDTKHGQAIHHANVKKGEAVTESKRYADSNKFAKTGGDLSGDVHIKKRANQSGEVKISEDNANHGLGVKYDGVENRVELYTWSGNVTQWFLRVARATKNAIFAGEIYAKENKRVYHDDYHPRAEAAGNADRLNGKTASGILGEAKGYTDQKHDEQAEAINNILGGVTPEHLDSIKELGKEIEENESAILGINNALTQKLGKTERAASANQAGYMESLDLRGVKPNSTGISTLARGVKAFFAERREAGIDGGSRFYDLLVLDSYKDSTGGNPNALAFGKNSKDIYHLQPDFDGDSWGTPYRIYTTAKPPTAAEVNAYDMAQSDSRYLPKGQSVALAPTLGVSAGRHHSIVGGGQYKSKSGVRGAIKITLPVSWTSAMLTFHIDIYNFHTGESTTLLIGGYNYSGGERSRWLKTTAIQQATENGESYIVRFGHDGSKCCVYIGEKDKDWSYPQIVVRNFHYGYAATNQEQWDNDWSIGFATEFQSVTETNVAVLPRASNAEKLGGVEKRGYQLSHKWVTKAVTNSYKTIAKVEGSRLASMIRLTGRGTTANTVVSFMADIIVNHYGNVVISGLSGNHTPVSIKIVSNNNEHYYIQVKRAEGAAGVDIEFNLLPLGGHDDGDKVTPYLNGESIPSSYTATKELTLIDNQLVSTGGITAQGLYDGEHRVYSAGNPPPKAASAESADKLGGLAPDSYVKHDGHWREFTKKYIVSATTILPLLDFAGSEVGKSGDRTFLVQSYPTGTGTVTASVWVIRVSQSKAISLRKAYSTGGPNNLDLFVDGGVVKCRSQHARGYAYICRITELGNDSTVFDHIHHSYSNVEVDNMLKNYAKKSDRETNFDAGESTTLRVRCDDSGMAEIAACGSGQGTGRVYAGQSRAHGGGIEYNGDSSPETTGAGSDYITLFRRSNDKDYWTARNKHDSNNWEFRGEVNAANVRIGGTKLSDLFQSKHAKLTNFLGSLWETTAGQDLRCRGKRALVGKAEAATGGLCLNYANDFGRITMYGFVNVLNEMRVNDYITRSGHSKGYFVGSYNNIGRNSDNTNPIYTIGSSYKPTDTELKNMYGIGYTYTGAAFLAAAKRAIGDSWGAYFAADGDARVFIGASNGRVWASDAFYEGNVRLDQKYLGKTAKAADADKLDGIESNGFCRAYSRSHSTGGGDWTTAQFVEFLKTKKAFDQPYWIMKGSWSYANNKRILDTGCGIIHLAGCVIEVMGYIGAYHIRITTPTTSSGGGTANATFIYVNHGAGYAPSWRRDYNTRRKPTASDVGAATTAQFESLSQSVSNASKVYKGSDAFTTTLPIGHPLLATDTQNVTFRVNSAHSVYVSDDGYYTLRNFSRTKKLSGIWRIRGFLHNAVLLQRVA